MADGLDELTRPRRWGELADVTQSPVQTDPYGDSLFQTARANDAAEKVAYARQEKLGNMYPHERRQFLAQERETEKVNRVRAADLADRGIPIYKDPETGSVSPLTDETGAALSGYDSHNQIAYDSQGQPREIAYGETGPPTLRDPFRNIPSRVDPKTGYIEKEGKGVYRYEGQDPQVTAELEQQAQDKELTKRAALMQRKLTLDEHDHTVGEREQKKAAEELQTHVPDLAADPEFEKADPATVHKAIDDHFNTEYAASEANATDGWFGGGELTPAAAQLRAGIDQRKAAAHAAADKLYSLKDRLGQLEATTTDLRDTIRAHDETLLAHSYGEAGPLDAGYVAGGDAGGQEPAATHLYPPESEWGRMLGGGATLDQLPAAKPGQPESDPVAAMAPKGKTYHVEADGNVVFSAEQPLKSLRQARDDGSVSQADAERMMPQMVKLQEQKALADRAAKELADKVNAAGGNSDTKAILNAIPRSAAIIAGTTYGAEAGAAGGAGVGALFGGGGAVPGAFVGGVIGAVAGGWGAGKLYDEAVHQAAKYSQLAKEVEASSEVHPIYNTVGELIGWGGLATRGGIKLAGAAKIAYEGAEAVKAGTGAATAAKLIATRASQGGATMVGINAAITEGGNALGLTEGHYDISQVPIDFVLGAGLSGSHIKFKDYSRAQVVDIMARGIHAGQSGMSVDRVLHPAELDIFNRVNDTWAAQKSAGQPIVTPESMRQAVLAPESVMTPEKYAAQVEKATRKLSPADRAIYNSVQAEMSPVDSTGAALSKPPVTLEEAMKRAAKEHGVTPQAVAEIYDGVMRPKAISVVSEKFGKGKQAQVGSGIAGEGPKGFDWNQPKPEPPAPEAPTEKPVKGKDVTPAPETPTVVPPEPKPTTKGGGTGGKEKSGGGETETETKAGILTPEPVQGLAEAEKAFIEQGGHADKLDAQNKLDALRKAFPDPAVRIQKIQEHLGPAPETPTATAPETPKPGTVIREITFGNGDKATVQHGKSVGGRDIIHIVDSSVSQKRQFNTVEDAEKAIRAMARQRGGEVAPATPETPEQSIVTNQDRVIAATKDLKVEGRPLHDVILEELAKPSMGRTAVAVKLQKHFPDMDLADLKSMVSAVKGWSQRQPTKPETTPTAETPAPPVQPETQPETTPIAKGTHEVQGVKVQLQYEAGETRKEGHQPLATHYGSLPGVKGADGDNVDVVVPKGTTADHKGPVFVLDQHKGGGEFDEHKVVFGKGVTDEASARAAYRSNFPKEIQLDKGARTFPDLKAATEWLSKAETPKAVETPETPTEPAAGTRVEGPALVDGEGNVLIQGKFSDPNLNTHDKLLAHATKNPAYADKIDEILAAHNYDEQHHFVDDAGNTHNRWGAAELGVKSGQLPEGTEEAHSELFAEAPKAEGPKTGVALPLPTGWTAVVGKTRTKEGRTAEAEVDWPNKRIVFANDEHMANVEIWNHEISHVRIESELPDAEREALYEAYNEIKGNKTETDKYWAHETISIDAGKYLTDPASVEPELRELFDHYLGEKPATEPATEPTPEPIADSERRKIAAQLRNDKNLGFPTQIPWRSVKVGETISYVDQHGEEQTGEVLAQTGDGETATWWMRGEGNPAPVTLPYITKAGTGPEAGPAVSPQKQELLERSRAAHQAYVDESRKAGLGENIKEDQFNETAEIVSENPERFHNVVEIPNAKGIKVGDRVMVVDKRFTGSQFPQPGWVTTFDDAGTGGVKAYVNLVGHYGGFISIDNLTPAPVAGAAPVAQTEPTPPAPTTAPTATSEMDAKLDALAADLFGEEPAATTPATEETPDAIQEPSPTGVLQHAPEGAGEQSGGQVESGEQGTAQPPETLETPTTGQASAPATKVTVFEVDESGTLVQVEVEPTQEMLREESLMAGYCKQLRECLE